MDSTHDYQWLDLGGSTNNLCKGETIRLQGSVYKFNKEGLLPKIHKENDVDKLARHIVVKKDLPFIVIVRCSDKSGWYIKYRMHRGSLNISDRMEFCRVIERL